MRGVPRLSLITSMLSSAALAAAATGAAPPPAPVAQSAQLILAAQPTPAGLTLRLRRASGEAPLMVTQLSVSIDGTSAPATRNADDSWSVSVPRTGGTAAPGKLEAIVAHDGIREVLSGSLPADAAAGATATGGRSALRDHQQMLWWILNIAIVLIAAIAVSRRMS